MKHLFLIFLSALFISACSKTSDSDANQDAFAVSDEFEGGEYIEYNNPPAEGFNQEGSDLLATLLADKVMNAMGGREAWDNTRFISWTFFGRRSHIWDKLEGNVRIEDSSKELTILMNINSMEGKVRVGEDEITHPDSLAKYLKLGSELWMNDSYWLVMPFKLKDSGVTLFYDSEDTTQTGAKSDVLRLTFDAVGVTPENIYQVWVDVDTKLITQWAFYASSESTEPDFITPWGDYNQYGEILLSGDRGGNRKLTDIKVMDEVPDGTFDSFDLIIQ